MLKGGFWALTWQFRYHVYDSRQTRTEDIGNVERIYAGLIAPGEESCVQENGLM